MAVAVWSAPLCEPQDTQVFSVSRSLLCLFEPEQPGPRKFASLHSALQVIAMRQSQLRCCTVRTWSGQLKLPHCCCAANTNISQSPHFASLGAPDLTHLCCHWEPQEQN